MLGHLDPTEDLYLHCIYLPTLTYPLSIYPSRERHLREA